MAAALHTLLTLWRLFLIKLSLSLSLSLISSPPRGHHDDDAVIVLFQKQTDYNTREPAANPTWASTMYPSAPACLDDIVVTEAEALGSI